jgi:hypothetical protein
MSIATLDEPMAGEKPKTMSIKLPMDVIESARIAAAFRGETMADLLGTILRPALAKIVHDEMAKRQAAEKRKAGGK